MPPSGTLRGCCRDGVDEAECGEEQRVSAAAPSSGAIHIEFPGRALVSVEGRVDAALVRIVLTTLASQVRLQGTGSAARLTDDPKVFIVIGVHSDPNGINDGLGPFRIAMQ